MKNLSLLLILLVCFSCKDSVNYRLNDALQNVYGNPTFTLSVLDSIHNPEKLNRETYMDYIRARTQARYLLDMDITNDTLIFEAQRYYDNNKDAAKSACTNFYAGVVYRKRRQHDYALNAFLKAERFAQKADDKYILARSQQMIANLYYVRGIMDIAIPRYEKALTYYKDIPDVDKYKLQTLKYLGVAYEERGVMDSAYNSYKKGLQLAQSTNNIAYQADLLQDIGIYYRENKEYGKALKNFRKTLAFDLNTRDSLRVYLNMAKVFNATNRIDSARFYTNLIVDRLDHIDDSYVLESMYGALAAYNMKAGNPEEAMQYLEKLHTVKEKIAESNNDLKFLTAEKHYKLSLKEKGEENLRMRFYILLVIVIAFLLCTLLYIRKKQKEKQLLEKENELLGYEKAAMKEQIENLSFIKDLQQNFINEWGSIEKEVKGLAIKYEATEEPTLYIRIRQMIEEVKAKTNNYLIGRGRTIILKHPLGKAALETLDESNLLVIMLCYLRYSTKGIAAMLGLVANNQNIERKKFDARNKLIRAGFSKEEANRMIFPDNFEGK